MSKYRKKPVLITAVRWTGENDADIRLFCSEPQDRVFVSTAVSTVLISTLEGTMTAQAGDWIIRGVKGELYPCKDDIFQATYECVDELEQSLGTSAFAAHNNERIHDAISSLEDEDQC